MMEIRFEVVRHNSSKKAGESEKHSVSLKSPDGHRLVLVGEDETVKEGFPLGQFILATIREFATLDKFDEKKEEGQ
jgi:hypothetical protein